MQPGVPTRFPHPKVHFSCFPVWFPHPPALNRQQKFPAEQGSDTQRHEAVHRQAEYPPQHNKQNRKGCLVCLLTLSLWSLSHQPSKPPRLGAQSLPHTTRPRSVPAWRGPLLISNAAHGAHYTCNGLNLGRLLFNYGRVITESVAWSSLNEMIFMLAFPEYVFYTDLQYFF